MIELNTSTEIIKKITEKIEKERLFQRLNQKELALKAGIPLATYKNFVYKNKLSLKNLIKLLQALALFDVIKSLTTPKEYKTIEAIKNENKLPKRIRTTAGNRL